MERTSRSDPTATGSESTRWFHWLSRGKTWQRVAPFGGWPLARAAAHANAATPAISRHGRINPEASGHDGRACPRWTDGPLRMRAVKQLAPDLWMLGGFPPNGINIYLIGDVLVDAGTRHSGRRIFRQLDGHRVAAHALTHAHPDHQGASKAVCDRLGVELWCGENDAEAMESGNLGQTDHPLNKVIKAMWQGPPRRVDRRLREGDEVAGFKVLDVP